MSSGQDPDSPAGAESWPPALPLEARPPLEARFAFGLARLKTEGEPIVYDPGGKPGPPLTRLQQLRRRVAAVGRRIRQIPGRVWWAIAGDDDYDSGW